MLTLPPDLARSILNAAPDAIIVVDTAGTVCFANQQVSTLFGYAHDEVVGRSVEQLVPERFRGRHAGLRSGYLKGGGARPMGQGLDLYGRRRDGSEFPVEISLSPIRDGDYVFAAAAIRDVSDRKRAEAQLITARESADRANQAKSRFLATASHDLRQPLQSLSLLNGTLRRIVVDPAANEALVQQDQAIAAMARLLNALLDIGKLESGAVKPALRDFKICELLDELRQEFAGLAASKGLRFDIDASTECVHSDPGLVEQILRNLASNAIKYTRRGFVRVQVERAGASVSIAVRDSGVGIPPDQLAYIYDEFYQVGVPSNSTRDGYGLGLSIVQRLVSLLGLGLEVRSEVGKGSTFTLTLQAGQESPRGVPPSASRPATAPAVATRATILLVEDDVAVRNATRLLLTVEGFSVTAVATLADAVASIRDNGAPQLLISDYHLADGETGTQVISAARRACGAGLKAILMTGDTSSAVSELPRDPALRLASKPVETEELLGLIRTLLVS